MSAFSVHFSHANGTHTVTLSCKQTVTICSIVGTLYIDFKMAPIQLLMLQTILACSCTVRAVLAPSRNHQAPLYGVHQRAMHLEHQHKLRSFAIDLSHPHMNQLKFNSSTGSFTLNVTQVQIYYCCKCITKYNRESAVESPNML